MRIFTFGKRLQSLDNTGNHQDPDDWIQAKPKWIEKSLERALALPSGGWYVVDASRRITETPSPYWIDGQEIVAWRVDGELRLAPNGCPHMGAPLSAGRVEGGQLVCPWHGLVLGDKPHGKWRPLEAHDDGVLTWIRLGETDSEVPRPILPARPQQYVDGVIRMVARCAPEDVIANRLDPWHGTHFHPHSFARLRVLDDRSDALKVRVAFRIAGPVCVEVDCTFHCPDPRTIVMTIVDGEGIGSVVETHATPVRPGYTAIVEATLAASDRKGFQVARRLSPLLRPLIERSARRLWVEDAAYAERRSFLREGSEIETWSELAEGSTPGTPKAR